MAKEKKKVVGVRGFVCALLASYAVSAVVMVVLALILYKWGLSEKIMAVGTIVTYILSGLAGGILMKKSGRSHSFLWGLLLGAVYYLVLLLLALVLPGREGMADMSVALNLAICMLAGMTGAMLSQKPRQTTR